MLNPGETATIPSGSNETWSVSNNGTLVMGPNTEARSIYSTLANVRIDGGTDRSARIVASGTSDGVNLSNGSLGTIAGATIVADTGLGLVLSAGRGQPGSQVPVSAQVTGSTITSAGLRAVQVGAGGSLDLSASTVTATGAGSYGLGLSMGKARVGPGASITGERNGIHLFGDARGTGVVDHSLTLIVDGATVQGMTESAIRTSRLNANQENSSTILIQGGSRLLGGNGVAIEVGANTSTDLSVAASQIDGDIVLGDLAKATVTLGRDASLNGAISGTVDLSIVDGGLWSMPRDSTLPSLHLSDGQVRFAAVGGEGRLHVSGDLGGTGGVIAMRSRLDAGGALADQSTDRLLIGGNVTTTGTTLLAVEGRGDGADTDLDGDGIAGPGEGISLVQVAGTSRADAFALRGGYVAAGAFQYTLHAFGPGQTDGAQNQLPSGPLSWDYRLGGRVVCERDCGPIDPPVDPENPDPGDGGDDGNGGGGGGDPGEPDIPGEPENPGEPGEPPPVERSAVVPQLPSYLSAPAALLTYGDMLNDGLRQRLGDIRQGKSGEPLGGETFVRYLGGQFRYTSNRSFRRYGYDFDQQVNALQFGSSLVSLDRDRGTLRAGWALDHGTTRVSPQAVDGNSSARYRAAGGAAWITWQAAGGGWVDAVVAAQRYRGDIATDMRGADMARIRASGTTLSAEAGKPFALGGDWMIEPSAQVKYQALRFEGFADADGLTVDLGTARQTSVRISALLSRIANPRLAPYARLDLTHTGNGDPTADVSSEAWNVRDRFGTGRVGNDVRVAAGVTSQLTPHVQLYGEGNYRHSVGSYGVRGWAGNLGVRVTF